MNLAPGDFVLYHHPRTGYPHVLDTCKIREPGWRSRSVEGAIERTVEERIDHVREKFDDAPNREAQRRLLSDVAE